MKKAISVKELIQPACVLINLRLDSGRAYQISAGQLSYDQWIKVTGAADRQLTYSPGLARWMSAAGKSLGFHQL